MLIHTAGSSKHFPFYCTVYNKLIKSMCVLTGGGGVTLCRRIENSTRHNEPFLNPTDWSQKLLTYKAASPGTTAHAKVNQVMHALILTLKKTTTINPNKYIREQIRLPVNKKPEWEQLYKGLVVPVDCM